MFHLTHAMKPRKEKKDEFLSLILVLDPIPDEVSAFLSLDNASFFTVPQADGSAHTAGHGPTFTSSSAFSSHMGTPVATPVKSSSPPYFASTTATTSVSASASGGGGGGSSNRPGGGKSNRHWWQNAGLIVSCLVMFTSAHFVSSVVSSVGKTTGICDEDSIGTHLFIFVSSFQATSRLIHTMLLLSVTVMVIYTAVSIGLHHQLLFLKARLEVLVVIIALWLYTHRVLGYALGLYLRHKLDPAHTGQFAFHFEWIALRLGLDQNMVVVHGAEWRNPGAFRNTPYLLRIDEASVVFDVMSIYSAVTSNTPIRIKEIRFNTVKLHLEKLSEESLLKAASEQQLVALAADSKARGESINGSSTERVDSTKPNEKSETFGFFPCGFSALLHFVSSSLFNICWSIYSRAFRQACAEAGRVEPLGGDGRHRRAAGGLPVEQRIRSDGLGCRWAQKQRGGRCGGRGNEI